MALPSKEVNLRYYILLLQCTLYSQSYRCDFGSKAL